MTQKAIDLLSSSPSGKKNGFFLQVESASIDKRDHSRDACGQIGETEQLDLAVQRALDFASRRTDTLVIVTADHAHTSQIVDGPTPGNDVKLRTTDGADMIVAYNTATGSQQHTGAQVRVGAYGPGAANVVGLIDQTDLFGTISRGMAARGRDR
jgi:alkaline phosphatase